jgi:hypothetical protein
LLQLLAKGHDPIRVDQEIIIHNIDLPLRDERKFLHHLSKRALKILVICDLPAEAEIALKRAAKGCLDQGTGIVKKVIIAVAVAGHLGAIWEGMLKSGLLDRPGLAGQPNAG